jgi:hypothetical protein
VDAGAVLTSVIRAHDGVVAIDRVTALAALAVAALLARSAARRQLTGAVAPAEIDRAWIAVVAVERVATAGATARSAAARRSAQARGIAAVPVRTGGSAVSRGAAGTAGSARRRELRASAGLHREPGRDDQRD